MKSFVVLASVLAVVAARIKLSPQNGDNPLTQPRIIGGQEAIPHQFPHQAALFIYTPDGTYFCGGSIISEYFVITAAHCPEGANSIDVLLGKHYILQDEPTQKLYRVTPDNIKIHEQWDRANIVNDIALLHIPEGIEFVAGIIGKIDLPRRSDRNNQFFLQTCMTSGWGRYTDLNNNISPVLKYVTSWIISKIRCNTEFLGSVKESNICMDGIGKSTCNGDSGGPLTVNKEGKPLLVGITSFGFLLCSVTMPSVFTRVTFYLDWIDVNTYYTIIQD